MFRVGPKPGDEIVSPKLGVGTHKAFVAWQEDMARRFPGLRAEKLDLILMETEQWKPMLPSEHFMQAWLGAATRVMSKMRPSAWVLASQLSPGVKPSRDFLVQFGLVARSLQLASPDYSMFALLEVQRVFGQSDRVSL